MTPDLTTAFIDAGLGPHLEQLVALVQPCIQLQATRAKDTALGVGASRIGGIPDLPRGLAWPAWRDGPLAFIGQLDLRDLRMFDAAKVLPTEGWLHFFYHAEQKTWGFDPKDRGSWQVFYTTSDVELVRTDPPRELSQDGRFHPCLLEFREILSLPPWESSDMEALHLSDQQSDAYLEVYENFAKTNDELPSRVLGHPNQLQGDMQLECALVTAGLYTGDASGYNDPRRTELQPSARDWRLLLQVDSEDAAGMMWGDGGSLYYWINRRDLAAHDFSRTWMILQCY